MQTQTPTERKDDASTDDETESCACTALMPCLEHYLGERGRPAVRRIA